jgi:hypothetical protein
LTFFQVHLKAGVEIGGAITMRRARFFIAAATAVLGLTCFAVQPASAVSAHFLFANGTVNSDGSLTVSFKEAGLGNSLNSVNISVSGTAECINGGGNHPKATNKTGVAASGTFSVSNGNATGTLTTNAPNFQPPCNPPMTVQFVNVVITDTTFNDSAPVKF